MQADSGSLPSSLVELESGGYMVKVPTGDGWGNAWVYTMATARGGTFTLTSLGADGRAGPAPPVDWTTGAFDVDIVFKDGQFLQAPASR